MVIDKNVDVGNYSDSTILFKLKGFEMKRFVLSILSVFMITVIISGCSSHHILKINEQYKPNKITKVKVDEITNKTGHNYKIDIKDMLKVAFEKQLKEANLLPDKNHNATIILNINILKYSEGNAFKRWLMPGFGSTKLSIEAILYNNNNNNKIGYRS